MGIVSRTFLYFAYFSFYGSKIITTSGGGMLASTVADFITHAGKLDPQVRAPASRYQYSEISYNYRSCSANNRACSRRFPWAVGLADHKARP